MQVENVASPKVEWVMQHSEPALSAFAVFESRTGQDS